MYGIKTDLDKVEGYNVLVEDIGKSHVTLSLQLNGVMTHFDEKFKLIADSWGETVNTSGSVYKLLDDTKYSLYYNDEIVGILNHCIFYSFRQCNF